MSKKTEKGGKETKKKNKVKIEKKTKEKKVKRPNDGSALEENDIKNYVLSNNVDFLLGSIYQRYIAPSPTSMTLLDFSNLVSEIKNMKSDVKPTFTFQEGISKLPDAFGTVPTICPLSFIDSKAPNAQLYKHHILRKTKEYCSLLTKQYKERIEQTSKLLEHTFFELDSSNNKQAAISTNVRTNFFKQHGNFSSKYIVPAFLDEIINRFNNTLADMKNETISRIDHTQQLTDKIDELRLQVKQRDNIIYDLIKRKNSRKYEKHKINRELKYLRRKLNELSSDDDQ